MSYDTWKSNNPADNELGRASGKPERIWCLTCGFRGKGALDRSIHYYQTGHTLIVPKDDPRYTQPQTDSEVA